MNGVDAGTATSDTPASALRPPSPQRTPMTERTAADAVMRRRPFRLLRYFSVASLIGLVAVTAALLWAYRALAEHHLVQHETRANAELTRAFSNGVWARYRGFVAESVGKRREQLLADPAIADLRADVLSNMRGLAVVKVKVYNIDGLTVFSTEDRQIGEIKRDNLGFTQAMAGLPVGAITHRDKFDAFEGVISNRDLIASYVPIQVSTGAPVEGVFEVYSDVTALLEKQRSAQWQVAALVLVLLSALYLFLLGVVRKADRVILSQESERAEREALVVHQAHHDALTGLPNRAYFAERLTEAISRSGRYGHACALMYIDLDRFKFVNDSLGHQAGDELLRVVAERIAGCLRDSDLLFRMGGDEFTVILSRISESEDAASIARRITAAVAEPLMLREHEINIGATAGIAVYPADGTSADALVKNADAAMYSAKKAGRGRHAFYSSDMNERAMRRLELETALKQGFRDGEFKLYYQPRLSALDRRIVAFEALLRWAPPGRPVVLPDEFVPVLEDIGMMPIVGEWMLRSACAQSVQWRIEGQRIAGAVPARELRWVGRARAARDGCRPVADRVGTHRVDAHRRRRADRPQHCRAQDPGVEYLDRRLRHRALIAELSAPPRGRLHQDRPQLRQRDHRQPARPRTGRVHHPARQGPGHRGGRGRRGVRGAGELLQRRGLRRTAGHSVLPGSAGRAASACPGCP
jgi:diguanylate cyclase (GGDEF)-like protein